MQCEQASVRRPDERRFSSREGVVPQRSRWYAASGAGEAARPVRRPSAMSCPGGSDARLTSAPVMRAIEVSCYVSERAAPSERGRRMVEGGGH